MRNRYSFIVMESCHLLVAGFDRDTVILEICTGRQKTSVWIGSRPFEPNLAVVVPDGLPPEPQKSAA
jgi:hypothetical protein